ncbi:MAG: hypothetical protein QF357_06960 [Dehalococcoidia bacterium]|nr:hypothetical protein [Dehalococcoidia bacterium]
MVKLRSSRYQTAAIVALALLLVGVIAACGDSSSDSGGSNSTSPGAASTDTPAPSPTTTDRVPSGPVRVVEHIEATSQDGVLFDLKLALPVFDQNGANGRRDDIEVVAPENTEYQGVFSDGPGTLLIVSCFADVCQADSRTATFEVMYWIESAPEPLPAGVSLAGG